MAKDLLIVSSKVKEYVAGPDKSFSVAGDLAEELDKQVKLLLDKAIKRASGNSRKTVMPKDV